LEHGLGLRATRQRVEHVEQHETGERHRRVARRDLVVRHLRIRIQIDVRVILTQFLKF
jgi:hypothetical protein